MSKTISILNTKSYAFAIRIVKLSQFLQKEKQEYVLSKQILRSGTAIGALVHEVEFAQSKAGFVNKLSISLKEANESKYWLSLLYDTAFLDEILFNSLHNDCKELVALLVSSIKTLKTTI
jgi:four helix bundle protein